MKKVVLSASLLVAVLAANAGGEKVKIMHNGHVIEVSVNALPAHLDHGDEIMILHNGEWLTESEYKAAIEKEENEAREDLQNLEKDYEEVGAESADVEGEEDVEE